MKTENDRELAHFGKLIKMLNEGVHPSDSEELMAAARALGMLAAEDTTPIAACEEQHFPNQPKGYLQWHDWAQEMNRTHVQSRCTRCGLWQVWTARTPRKRAATQAGGNTQSSLDMRSL